MAIEEINITTGKIKRVCDACGKTDELTIASLVAGTGRNSRVKNDLVITPPCSGCSAGETWVRNWDTAPEKVRNTAFGKRRAAVNAIIQKLIADGQSHADCATAHNAETKTPPDLADLTKDAERKPPLPRQTASKKAAFSG